MMFYHLGITFNKIRPVNFSIHNLKAIEKWTRVKSRHFMIQLIVIISLSDHMHPPDDLVHGKLNKRIRVV